MKILLMGNPNVGKSVIFSRLTGVRVITSNYPGTTVSYHSGFMKLGDETVEVIDVPGTYTLEPTSEAEQIALKMFGDGDLVINVVDATNLERNLYLTLQLMEHNIPMVMSLNIWDDTKHKGISIDVAQLKELLGIPVIPTVAVTGQGIKELVETLPQATAPTLHQSSHDQRWVSVGNIIEQVQHISHRHHSWKERLGDASVRPLSGGIIALLVLAGTFISDLLYMMVDPRIRL